MTSTGQEAAHPLGSVLIVEDDPVVALLEADVLRAAGADPVETCSTSEEARAVLDRMRPDIVILDVRLADRTDGWAFAELLALMGPRQPQVIFATGLPESIPPHVAALGTVLAKPFSPQDLLAAIHRRRGGGGLIDRLRGALSGTG